MWGFCPVLVALVHAYAASKDVLLHKLGHLATHIKSGINMGMAISISSWHGCNGCAVCLWLCWMRGLLTFV